MLTFFTTAKPFQGRSAIIQRNALQSWRLLDPRIEVILFGDDEGAAGVCAELGLRHEPHVERHESGMKYLHNIFARAQELSCNKYLCYSNCDIVQLPEFWVALNKTLKWKQRFLMVGRRWDTEISQPIDFRERDWSRRLREMATATGRQQIADFIDFFVFPRGLYGQMPPLVVGRSYWDHWLVWKALSSGVPVVDCSRFIVAVHQNHDYFYHPHGKLGTNEDTLAKRNMALCGQGKHLRSMSDATHAMTARGRIVPTPFRRTFSLLYAMRHRQGFLENTFALRESLGLRREPLQRLQRRIAGWFRGEM